MSYADKLVELTPTPCQLAILTLDYCSLTYGVGDCTASGGAGSECYNTYPTCQAKTAFSKTTKSYKFTTHEAPLPFLEGERPYIKSISYLPTEIKSSLTVKGRIKLTMADESDTDIGIDPYVANRSSVQGSFWKKLLARNPNFKGRPLKLYDGFIGLTESDFTTDGKLFTGIVENITVDSKNGTITIEAADLLRSLDDIEIPAKLNIRLATDISDVQNSITLDGSDVGEMDSPTGYIRIGDEIIYYGAINTTTKILSSCTRAMFGTSANTYTASTKVQAVKYYTEDNPFDTMQQILTDAGIAAGDIDSTAFAAEKAFVADLNVMAVISEPTEASELYYSLVELMDCKTWVSESLKITIARNLPNRPGRTYTELSDDENIIDNSASVDLNQESLITRCSIYWDKTQMNDADEATSYNRIIVVVDADAESGNEYNQISEKTIKSIWLSPDVTATEEEIEGWVNSLAMRHVWQQRDPQHLLNLEVSLKDAELLTGQYAYLTTEELLDKNGAGLDGTAFQVVRRERKDGKIALKLLRLPAKKVAYFAPADAPDYSSATDAEKQAYGYFTGADGYMADGSDGYVFF
ncbi:MAG: hypothetical protein PHS64_00265 [Candidatus Omnitrophica bacterium]|nr:hypothetical protein [Candidatus Omnitrophota bacterium]